MSEQNQCTEKKPLSACAVVGLVLGAVALLTSFLPIINNMSFVVAFAGAVFAIVGIIGTSRGSKNGKVVAIVALVVCILSAAVVLATQSMYSAALDDAVNGPSAVSTENNTAAGENQQQSATDLTVGASVTLENGLVVTVNSVTSGLINYDGSTATGVNVTYVNNGTQSISFNPLDWKAQDAQGAQRSNTYFAGATDDLNYGDLTAGGTVSGTVYFEGEITKVLYFSSLITKEAAASWNAA